MKKAIITGVAGFIGSHFAERWLQRGCRIIGIDNLSRAGSLNNLEYLRSLPSSGRFEFYPADVRIANDVERVFRDHRDADAVVHEAAQVAVTSSVSDPRLDFETNAGGTFNVLEAARAWSPNSVFLYPSTNKVYGSLDQLGAVECSTRYAYRNGFRGIRESEPLDPHSPYACSKTAAEQYVRDYARMFGLRTVVFRQSCIYGLRQYGIEDQGWVAWLSLAALHGRTIHVYGDGKQTRDVLWIDDLLDLYDRALECSGRIAGAVYNAGGGPENTLSLLELIEQLKSNLGYRPETEFRDWRPGDQKIFISDCTAAKDTLGWVPKTSPREGVENLLAWMKEKAGSL